MFAQGGLWNEDRPRAFSAGMSALGGSQPVDATQVSARRRFVRRLTSSCATKLLERITSFYRPLRGERCADRSHSPRHRVES
jgi:hypothetical protein